MKLSVKDPGSALTHFIAMILAVLAAAPLLLKAAFFTDRLHVAALAVFIVSMILLYAAIHCCTRKKKVKCSSAVA